MNPADFEDLLDRLGDDMSAWPSDQQDAAAVLLRESQEARDLLHEARVLRRALSADPVRADPALTDRIMQRIREPDPAPPAETASSSDPGSGVLSALKQRLRGLFPSDMS